MAIFDKYTQIFQNLIKNYLKHQSLKKRVVFDFVLSPKGACHSHGGDFSQKMGSQRVPQGPGSVVLIPEENIVLMSEESNGFMSITGKLINYKENWKLRFSPKMQNHLQISS